jgi:hypothetical protein
MRRLHSYFVNVGQAFHQQTSLIKYVDTFIAKLRMQYGTKIPIFHHKSNR